MKPSFQPQSGRPVGRALQNPQSAGDPTAEEVSAALAALLDAPGFRASERNKRFLQYVVSETIAGRGDRLKSFSIAVDVFGRGMEFDGSTNSIVRTEATRLRAALVRYYASEGADDAIRILLPPGSYVPRFERRNSPDDEVGPQPAPVSHEEAQPPPQASNRRLWLGLGAAAVLIAVVLLAAQTLRSRFSKPEISSYPVVIVAPTRTLEENPRIRDMARGLTQSLTLALSRYNGLRVAQATQRMPVESLEASRQGKDGALYILDSSLDAESARLRFGWRLISASDQSVLWSDHRDESVGDAMNLEDQIAEGVARFVATPGGLLQRAELLSSRAHSDSGYGCILLTMYYTQTQSVALHRDVRDCLERTVAETPDDGEAWALLSYVYLDESRNGFNPRGDKADIQTRAMAASNRALALAPMSSLVLQMRSAVLFQFGDDAGFEQAARQAIALNPGNPIRLALFGNRLFALGRYDEAMALLHKAIALDPVPNALIEHSMTIDNSYRLGDYRAAAEEAESLDVDPNHYAFPMLFAAIYGELGDKARAEENVAKLLKLRPNYAKEFRADWRNRRFREEFIDKVADGLRKAGLPVE